MSPSTFRAPLALLGTLALACALHLSWTPEAAATTATSEAATSEAATSEAADRGQAKKAPDWPQFRGPRGDGKLTGVELADRWPADGPARAWAVPLGGGFSGISAVDGTLYTLYSAKESEYLGAFDAATGKRLFDHRIDDLRRDQFGDGPRSTPTIEGDRVWAVSSLGHLWCLDRKTGKPIWDRDLHEEFGAVVPTWGVSATPVLFEDLLLFDVGGKPGHGLMAFHKETGEVAWKSDSGLPGYSLPLTIEAAGRLQTIFFTGTRVLSVDPRTGEHLWAQPWKTAYDVNAAAPVYLGDGKLFVSSGYDTGSSLFQIKEQADGELGVELTWRAPSMKNQFSSSIYHDGYLYGFDNKALECLDVRSGETLWRKSGFGHGSLLFADDKLVVLGDNGKLALVEANPEAYTEKGMTQVASGKHWTVPTLYAGHLYVRNERELIAYRLGS